MTFDGYRGYISLARRFGKWQPHITWSQSWDNRDTDDFPAPAAGFGLEGVHQELQNEIHSNILDQKTLSLGVRYDIARNMALKFQWDITNVSENSLGAFDSRADDNTLNGGTYNWWSLSFEWVF